MLQKVSLLILFFSTNLMAMGTCPPTRAELLKKIGEGCADYSCEMPNPMSPNKGKSVFEINGKRDGNCMYKEIHAQIQIDCQLSPTSVGKIAASKNPDKVMQEIANNSRDCKIKTAAQLERERKAKMVQKDGEECIEGFEEKMMKNIELDCKPISCFRKNYKFQVGLDQKECTITRINSEKTRKCPVPADAIKGMKKLSTIPEKMAFMDKNYKTLCKVTDTVGETKKEMLAVDLKLEKEKFAAFQEENRKNPMPEDVATKMAQDFEKNIRDLQAKIK